MSDLRNELNDMAANLGRMSVSAGKIEAREVRLENALKCLLQYFGHPVGVEMQELGRDAYIDLSVKVRIGDLMNARSLVSHPPGVPYARG